MRRRINHTGREKILRSSIKISIDRRIDDELKCRLIRELSGYGFDPGAPVVFECYAGAQYERIAHGTVANPPAVSVFDLSDFSTAPKLLFRVKVLDPKGTGKLLGIADEIPVVKPGIDDDASVSLVRVQPWDLGQRLWSTENDTDGPILAINKEIADWRGFVYGSPLFLPLVLPQFVSSVLSRILIEDEHQPNTDNDTWEDKFIDLAGTSGNRPFTRAEQSDPDLIRKWIDDVVDGFATKHKFADTFLRTIQNES
jgi:hypothetical protein